MDSFIVSARKYRPLSFATVVGQDVITSTLKNAIRNQQIAQAFLFTGPRGVGKTTCARILAKTINCEQITSDGEACNKCASCQSFSKSASFNIYELDAASNNSIDDIRTLVDQVRIPPQAGKYKVYIIDEVHMLSQAAFNAFLKTLEEPPAYAKFILATTEKHKIIPTILSRCQIFDFKRIGVEDIAGHLAYVARSEHIEAEADALHVIAQKADGGLRDALSMFDQLVSFAGNTLTYRQVIDNLNVLDHEYYFKITDFILSGDISHALLVLNEIIDNGFEGQHFMTGMAQHLRNLLVCQDKETLKLLETSANIRNQYLEQTGRCSASMLLKTLDVCNGFDIDFRNSNNKRLHLEIALMQMCLTANPQAATIDKIPVKPSVVVHSLELKVPEAAPVKLNAVPSAEPLKPEPAVTQPIASQTVVQNEAKDEIKEHPLENKVKESKPAFSTYTGVNLSGLMGSGDVAASAVSESETTAGEPTVPSMLNAFTQADLESAWKAMAVEVASDHPNLLATLTCRPPLLDGDTRIIVTVDNKIQDGYIFENRPAMVVYLRNALRNTSISIETYISEKPVEERKPYTDTERFDALARNNPEIKKLKDQLNLDIDM